jgi:hypothetical protein
MVDAIDRYQKLDQPWVDHHQRVQQTDCLDQVDVGSDTVALRSSRSIVPGNEVPYTGRCFLGASRQRA